jgi:hypothetical protein
MRRIIRTRGRGCVRVEEMRVRGVDEDNGRNGGDGSRDLGWDPFLIQHKVLC